MNVYCKKIFYFINCKHYLKIGVGKAMVAKNTKNNRVARVAKSAWWSIMLAGLLSVLLGLFAVFWPGLTVSILVHVFSIFFIIFGAIWMIASFASMKADRIWWLSLLFAVICMAIGIYLFANPSTTISIFVVLIVIAIFVQALVDLVSASYSDQKEDKVLWTIVGLLGIVFGLAIIFYPTNITLAFVWVLGLYAFVHGIVTIVYAFRAKRTVRRIAKNVKSTKTN